MRPSYAGATPYPTPPEEATTVFARPEPPAASPSPRRTPAWSATAALGAVMIGGLVASQLGAAAEHAPSVDAAADSGSLDAMLSLQPAGHESSLPDAAPAVLPVPSTPDAAMDQRDIEELHKGDDLIRRSAAFHAEAAREAALMRAGLDGWISIALQKLGLDQSLAPGVKRIILEESRGNPQAVNRWDSNAMAGRPSQGLMQVIPSTYLTYVLPELAGRPITDPVANITAGIRYMLANYGYNTLRQGGRYTANGYYVGY